MLNTFFIMKRLDIERSDYEGLYYQGSTVILKFDETIMVKNQII